MSEDNRRDEWHTYGNVKFYLSDFFPDIEETRFLMLKVIEQTIRDYCSLHTSQITSEKILWEEARDFIYDDDYRFNWGELELSTEAFLDILDLDINYFREMTAKRFKNKVI